MLRRARPNQMFSLLLLAASGAISSGSAQTADPLQSVKDSVAIEAASTEHPTDYWMYRLSKETKSGTQVKDMAETKAGIVARLISVNGRELTPDERKADDDRLAHLAADPAEQRRKLDDQKTEQKRFLSLLTALPDALIYTDDGGEMLNGRDTVRLKFRPNPSFHTTTRETIIFRASEGTLFIDRAEKRIVKMDALLTTDINIGWGILGHINKGGKLQMEQVRMGENKWKLSKLVIEATGQILFFKSISLKQRQFASGFRLIPPDISIADAINLLRKSENTVATVPPLAQPK